MSVITDKLTDKRLWMLVLFVAIVGIIGLAAFELDIPEALNNLVYAALGGGVAGSVAGKGRATPD